MPSVWWELGQMTIDGAPKYRVPLGSPNDAYTQWAKVIGEFTRRRRILNQIQPCV